ncbi:hypothetical protein MRB53_015514 [Persea americana]|uniref:Uncharacterized protein n=1 Tax=Persea americana TaxID=3435 RepID=A0ACC2LZK1_PERAE|nr:hypothetical protein MRB53_015514 [Persea americana]
MKELGELRHFLGLVVIRSKEGILLCQQSYAKKLLGRFGMTNYSDIATPVEVNAKLLQDEGEELEDKVMYRQLVGSLIYLTLIRLDIAHGVHVVSRFMQRPRGPHLDAICRILRECITISGDPQKKNKALLRSKAIAPLPQFKAFAMHKTHFHDLHFRLGSGYLYCHQGDCRHIIVVRDMRLIHPDDVQNRALYPIVSFQLKAHWRKCSVCRTFRATKVTVNDKWAEDNPCYFCESCYFLLHYSEDGSLLYNEFEVYDYHQEF